MKRLTNAPTAFFLAAILGLVVTVGLPQVALSSSDAMTVDEVTDTFIGKTSIGTYKKLGAKFAQYFAPDGSSIMKVRHAHIGVKQFRGKHYFNDQGKFCAKYPTLPSTNKVFCSNIIPAGEGRYILSGNLGFIKEVVDGKQLNRLR